MSNSLVESDPSKYQLVNGWTVETISPEEESEKRKFEWIATVSSKCEILIAKKFRNTDYIVDIYLEVKGEGRMGFSYTPYEGNITIENVLTDIVKECTTVLTGIAAQQWECMKADGRKAS